jgi:translation elongation factor EF-Tu-like GTPase
MVQMTVQEVFFIRGRGAVATGRVEYGEPRFSKFEKSDFTAGDMIKSAGICLA